MGNIFALLCASTFPYMETLENAISLVREAEKINFSAQMNAFYNILSEKGMNDEAVRVLINRWLEDKSEGDRSRFNTYIISQLARNAETRQTEVEARIFYDVLEGTVEWDDFCLYCSVISGMIMIDFNALKEVKDSGGKIEINSKEMSERQKMEYGRLEGIGLLSNSYNPQSPFKANYDDNEVSFAGDNREKENNYELTFIGKKISEYLG